MELTVEQDSELRALINSRDVPATVATRARIVLWRAEGWRRKDIAPMAGVALPTVDRWLDRYAAQGIAGLEERRRGASREQVPSGVRERVVELTVSAPPASTGLTHWSCRELAAYLKRSEGVVVSFHYVAKVWRAEGVQPHRRRTPHDNNHPPVPA